MTGSFAYKRKLAGTTFLVLRILCDSAALFFVLWEIFNDLSLSKAPNFVFLAFTFLDALLCGCFLIYPKLTCEGNGYLKCLPFIVNSYASNVTIYFIQVPNLLYSDRPERRIPYISSLNIISLIMYGGLACPLNLAWMETFKPFSKVLLVNRKLSTVSQGKK